ncbi:hypothetical protein C9374_012424 [Naegleria lovaniensis]|uniref:Cytochrome b5 heme-binding domain-containing protein n=1 Tax=Naegleria lovaniensis TaxID=51637 RepID=A0AA88H2R7_NAELO|nr:uncharacterized protein C9374_012424 [Naegleria lovaniensis]KAG2392172.1 hypothetical protein C9374_012424 [Naegleria lovaniensis]
MSLVEFLTSPLGLGLSVGLTLVIIYFVFFTGNSDETPTNETDEIVHSNRAGITRKEVAEHNSMDDLWVIIDNKVYDLTKFAPSHPGGDVIARNAGGDATAGFYGIQHPERAFVEIEDMIVGTLKEEEHARYITPEEIAKHNTEKDCWIVIATRVYDVSPFLKTHPGGVSAIMKYAGGKQDATKAFLDNPSHPFPDAKSDLYPLFIGYVSKDGVNPFSDNKKKAAVEKQKKLAVK